jgi:segregation and condensation protein B
MTDSRVDVPVDRDPHAAEPDPETRATNEVSPDSDRLAAASGDRPLTRSVDLDPTRQVPAESELHKPAMAEPGTAPWSGPTPDGQGNSDQVVPGPSDVGSAQVDMAEYDGTVQVASAAAEASPAPADHAEDAAGDSDQAQPTQVNGDPDAGVAPALREPDEAALRLTEAAVFASATPMTARALSQILPDDLDPAAVIAALQARYAGRGIELCEIGGGLQFRTAADLAPQLRKVVQVPRRLPRVALETLAIVAYHQPITRPEIEDLRGTGLSQQTLDVLLENDLIVARGRKETPGRPTLWGTTAKFLEYFGLRDIRELPRRQDLLLEAVRPETAAEADAIPSENTQSGLAGAPPR